MLKTLLSAISTFALTLVVFGASAAPDSINRHHARTAVHAPSATFQEMRAVYGGDAGPSRLNDGLNHDPLFSIQQDEIYEGRF